MTATPATSSLPPAWAALQAALHQRRPVLVTYHGRQRRICPHALGFNNGRPMVLGYQTGGQTSTGALPANPRLRWRCLFIDEIDQLDLIVPPSPWATADNYNPARPFNFNADIVLAIPPPATSKAALR